ncbi:MAG: hypothetical protein JRH11_15565 [Deltaproteobacteria bacterium]|nr:hypothetical protein [Deltaproteobacteria bacterium]
MSREGGGGAQAGQRQASPGGVDEAPALEVQESLGDPRRAGPDAPSDSRCVDFGGDAIENEERIEGAENECFNRGC